MIIEEDIVEIRDRVEKLKENLEEANFLQGLSGVPVSRLEMNALFQGMDLVVRCVEQMAGKR